MPDPRPAVGKLTHAEALAEVLNLKRILSAERRRHSHLEEALSQYLQGLEEDRAGLRQALLKSLTLYPSQPEKN
jgi:hypothetical protein